MTLNWLQHGGFSDVQPGLLKPEQNAQMYALAAPLKPKFWRIMAGWNYIAKQPEPGPSVTGPTYDTGSGVMYQPPTTRNRDWSSLDRCVNNIIRLTGAEPIIMVGQNRPRYGGGQGSGGLFQLFGGFASALSGGLFGALGAGMTSPVTAVDYGDFAAEVAERYKPGGLGIATDLRAAGKGVTFYEGWNEPNSKYTWVKNVDVKMFVDYQKELYNSIKAVSGLSGAASKILIGGMTHVPQGGAWYGDGWLTEQEIDFIKRAYDNGIQPYFDAMSIHPYTGQDARLTGYSPDLTDNAIVQAIAIRAEMVARGDSSKPVYITEFGFSTALCTEAEQATFQQTAFELVRDNMPWVEMYLVYCLRDSGTNPRALNQTLGALRNDMTPKPLYAYLLALTPEARTFNLGMTLGMGFGGASRQSAVVALNMTLGLGMTAVGRSAATFDLGMTLGLGMAAGAAYPVTFSLGMALGMGMSLPGNQSADVTLPLALSLGMAGTAAYTRDFSLGMTLGLAMTATASYTASFGLPMTLGLGMSAVDREAGSVNLGLTLGLGMSGTGQSAAITIVSIVGAEWTGNAPNPLLAALGTHASGDQILGFAYNSNFSTLPSLPAGWTAPTNGTRNQSASAGARTAYKTAASSAESADNWGTAPNAAIIAAIRNGTIGAVATTSGSSASVTTPALTLQVATGTSKVLVFAAISNATGGNLNTPPAGFTALLNVETGSDSDAAAYITTAGVTSFAGGDVINHTVGAAWITFAVEIKA